MEKEEEENQQFTISFSKTSYTKPMAVIEGWTPDAINVHADNDIKTANEKRIAEEERQSVIRYTANF